MGPSFPPAAPKSTVRPIHRAPWPAILYLIGLDYFSTLAYQPSIAYQAAGVLAPLASLVLAAVTLLVALPIYAYVAARSPEGQGATRLIERHVAGWVGKLAVLVLLGFAATDFVFTRTLSVADAAVHLTHNPSRHWQGLLDTLFHAGETIRPSPDHPLAPWVAGLWNRQVVTTLLLLTLGFVFWGLFRRGFTRGVIRLAVVVTGIYLALTTLVVGSGVACLADHPGLFFAWWERAQDAGRLGWLPPLPDAQWVGVALTSLFLFPPLALGLSGFEMGMVVVPLVSGRDAKSRARHTRAMLACAAVIMATLLPASALVTTVFIPEGALAAGGDADNRALAYLAHGGQVVGLPAGEALSPVFGEPFGTAYDISTVLTLCLAGASVMIGLRDLVPPYLHRLGMELHWARAVGAVLHLSNVVKLAITLFFHADVTSQRGALATSMLVLFAGAAAATALDRWPGKGRSPTARRPWLCAAVACALFATALAVAARRPAGLAIALALVGTILVTSMLSRLLRTNELRLGGFRFASPESEFLWKSLQHLEFPVIVPHRPGHHGLEEKEAKIRARHRIAPEVPVVFVEAELGDPSDFTQEPLLEVTQEDGRFVLRLTHCPSIPHALAALALELSKGGLPPEIHFGWSDESPLRANLNFVLFGEGNVPWMVRELIRRAEPEPARQPRVVIG